MYCLLSESNLTFDTAVKISAAFEAANRHVETISAAQNEVKHVCAGSCNKLENCRYVSSMKNAKRQVNTARNDAVITCFRCGVMGHKMLECMHINAICSRCHKRVCRSSSSTQGTKAEKSEVYYTDSGQVRREHTRVNEDHYGTLFDINLSIDQVQAYKVSLQLKGKSHEFEVDSGAALTIVNQDVFIKLWPDVKKNLCFNLHCGGGGGGKRVQVYYEVSVKHLEKYEPLFHEEGLPPLKVPPVHIKLTMDAEYKLLKVRSVAILLRVKMSFPFPPSRWEGETHLGCSEVLSQLDVKQSYFQLLVDYATVEILTLSTSKGLMHVRRLPQGL
ncbi:hypothetical protein PR048_023531 [Dryococelus australis]|uniref:CCHC-type domain-containing protein n=1 Tax=Dryococelus australis TaxID=614101 RepID=A0ABQ9GUB3_9NEOP|nr:hypothetical protein PR048_023531 [Dryococelus australis]